MLIQFFKKIKFNTSYLGVFLLPLLLHIVFFSNGAFGQKEQFVIVLDAGHGGRDPGNTGNGYREKNIVLNVVLELGKILDKERSISIKYTRTKDVSVDLWERGNIANAYKADLFVSIHCNSHGSSAYGTESFVLGLGAIDRNLKVVQDFVKKENAVIYKEENYQEKYKDFDPHSTESVVELSLMQEENLEKSLMLASSIQKNFRVDLKRKDRGVKQQRFVVLYQTYMPSILVELGFLTNKSEGEYLSSKKGQQQMAKAIAKAIKKYVNQLRLNTVFVENEVIVDQNSETEDKKEVTERATKDAILFKVQIASGKKKIPAKSYNFKGLKRIERVKVGRYYKYYYGNSSSYQTAKRALTIAKQRGYKTSLIVAFKNGKKVPLNQILK